MTVSSPGSVEPILAAFSPQERAMILQGQRDLLAKRRADLEFRRALSEREPPPLFSARRAATTPSTVLASSAPVASRFPVDASRTARRLSSRRVEFSRDILDPEAMTRRALVLAAPQLASLRPSVQERARTVYTVLVEAAYTLVALRQQSRHVTSYTFFTVLDTLPVVTGMSMATCERALADLRELGLINTRRWYTQGRFRSEDGSAYIEQACCGGVFLCVLLRASATARARVREEDTQIVPRDLQADRKSGRTAWQHRKEASEDGVRESSSYQDRKVLYMQGLLSWALKDTSTDPLVGVDSLTGAASPADIVWGLSNVLSTTPQGRGEAIEVAAHALSRLYRDPKSFKHYCRLLHRAVAAEFRGVPALSRLQNALQRVLVGMSERGLTRPGAVLVRELKEGGWWDEVYRAA